MSRQAKRGASLIILIASLVALAPLSIDAYLPTLPVLAHYFGTSHASVQHSLSTFFLGLAIGQLIYGPVSDRFGRRPVLFFGIVLYLLTSVLCAQAVTVGMLIAGRFLEGVGAAAGPVVGRAIVRDTWEGEYAARAMSYVIMTMTTVPVLAPIIGGHMLSWFDWQSIFWLMTGFGLVCFFTVALLLEESNPSGRGWQVSIWQRFFIFGRLLRDLRVLAYLVCGGSVFGVLFSFITGSSFVYIKVYGVAPSHFGYYFAINVLAMTSANFINGRLVTRYGYRRLLGIAAAAVVIAVSLVPLLAVLKVGGLFGVIVPMFFATGGIGVVASNTVTGMLNIAPESSGAVSSLFGVSQFLFAAMASACVGALQTGPTLAMGIVMFTLSLLAYLAQWLLRRFEAIWAERSPLQAGQHTQHS